MIDLEEARQWLNVHKQRKEELLYLLNFKNGFHAFEPALHVFPDLSKNVNS
jgi:hypothetical protein